MIAEEGVVHLLMLACIFSSSSSCGLVSLVDEFVLSPVVSSDISRNIATIKTFQQNRKMKSTSLAVRATLVFKMRGVNTLKRRMLDMGKLKLQSMGGSFRSGDGLDLDEPQEQQQQQSGSGGGGSDMNDKDGDSKKTEKSDLEGEGEARAGDEQKAYQLTKRASTGPLWYDDEVPAQ